MQSINVSVVNIFVKSGKGMSRIGVQPIQKPKDVTVTFEKPVLSVKGPLGELSLSIPSKIAVTISDEDILVERKSETKQTKSDHGTTRSHIANMIVGVTQGFKKEMEIVGMGYRASMEGKTLVMSLGWSHPVKVVPPEGVTFNVNDNVFVEVSGINKQLVGLWAAKIRSIRKPEPYRGKGIRYKDEVVRRKVGKSVEKA